MQKPFPSAENNHHHVLRAKRRRLAFSYQESTNYLLVVLTGLVVTILATRLFLFVTGYPQLGGGGLHIAHVLWGGLLMFISGIIFLTQRDKRLFAAGLLGIGMGLFIDELGKFITSDVNYFFEPAAPIIYFFIICVYLIYDQVKRRDGFDPRVELLHQLELVEESVMDGISEEDRAAILTNLHKVKAKSDDEDVQELAEKLIAHMESQSVWIESPTAPWYYKGVDFLVRQVRRSITRLSDWWRVVITYFVLRLFSALFVVVSYLFVLATPSETQISSRFALFGDMVRAFELTRSYEQVLLAVEAISYLVVAFFLILAIETARRRPRLSMRYGRNALMLCLLVADLFAFYFLQFEAALITLFDLMVLAAINLRQQQIETEGIPVSENAAEAGERDRRG